MRASEFITEAHHFIIDQWKSGEWTVKLSSHAVVSLPERGQKTDIYTIVDFICKQTTGPKNIQKGKGACFYDTTSKNALWISRSKAYPWEITVETLFGPEMKLPQPLFYVDVPNSIRQDNDPMDPHINKILDLIGNQVKDRGRDAVSAELETIGKFLKWRDEQVAQQTRQQRRAVERRAKKADKE